MIRHVVVVVVVVVVVPIPGQHSLCREVDGAVDRRL